MSKKAKVLASVLVAVVLLVVAGTATVIAADDNQTAPPPPRSVQSRAAEKLGIPEDKLTGAFKEAQVERRDEIFYRNLDKAVEKGRLTADNATAIKAWWQARPKAVDSLFPRALGAPNQRGRPMGFGMRGGMPKPPLPPPPVQ